jgi:phosphatidylserine/phosphatidylglycerophosphate/cardiolipin synthase-like enzyme
MPSSLLDSRVHLLVAFHLVLPRRAIVPDVPIERCLYARCHAGALAGMTRPMLLSLLTLALPLFPADLMLKNTPAQVYFSPQGGCTDDVVSTINRARKTIFVQAYSFTSAPIAQALKQAHDRGVSVMAILDRSQCTEKYSGMTYLVHTGIPT